MHMACPVNARDIRDVGFDLGQEDSLDERMTWLPWREEHSRPPSWGLRVRHD